MIFIIATSEGFKSYEKFIVITKIADISTLKYSILTVSYLSMPIVFGNKKISPDLRIWVYINKVSYGNHNNEHGDDILLDKWKKWLYLIALSFAPIWSRSKVPNLLFSINSQFSIASKPCARLSSTSTTGARRNHSSHSHLPKL